MVHMNLLSVCEASDGTLIELTGIIIKNDNIIASTSFFYFSYVERI